MKHITFSQPGGASLHHGLKQLQSEDTVMALSDSLNVGPINEPWSMERKEFMNSIWQSSPDPAMTLAVIEEWVQEISQFWLEVLNNDQITIWWSSKSAIDWCGLMMLLEHLDENIQIRHIDVSALSGNSNGATVEELNPEKLVSLRNDSAQLSQRRREKLQKKWEVLKGQQEKPVRWLTTKGIVSVQWDIIDKSLLENMERMEVVPAAHLIAECLCVYLEEYRQITDSILWFRLQHLISQKRIMIISRRKSLCFDSKIQIA